MQDTSASHNLVSAAPSELFLTFADINRGHSQDLEAAARASAELSERVEILQQALNDQEHDQDARVAAGADEGDNVWSAIVDSQSEVSRLCSGASKRGFETQGLPANLLLRLPYSS